jgi:hypothetical protein
MGPFSKRNKTAPVRSRNCILIALTNYKLCRIKQQTIILIFFFFRRVLWTWRPDPDLC